MSDTIYLDYQASTPVDPRVTAVVLQFFTAEYADPHAEHTAGWRGHAAVAEAASQIAKAIKAHAQEITFTSGATEANNTAIFGAAMRASKGRTRILTSSIEHKSVLGCAEIAAARFGLQLEILRV